MGNPNANYDYSDKPSNTEEPTSDGGTPWFGIFCLIVVAMVLIGMLYFAFFYKG
jgi:ABC-type transport system involved in multi-copper enzyme maturation permease subunit